MGTGLVDQERLQVFYLGSALIAGLIGADGEPLATYAWGASLDPDGETVRVLLPTLEVAALGHPDDDPTGTTMALNCTDVRTLRSLQVKGPITAIGPVDEADLSTRDHYCERYFDAVIEVDIISRDLMERMIPDELVACTFTITEAYDQTPGPGAGASIAGGR